MQERYRATLRRRFASYIIDLMVLMTACFPVFVWFVRGLFSERSGIFLLGYSVVVFYGFILMRFLYLCLLWRFGGTVGERLLNLRITGRDGNRLSFLRCIVRALSLPLDTITLALVFLIRPHSGLHDRISCSEVVWEPGGRKRTQDEKGTAISH